SCSRGDVAATFSDNAPWPASSRCNEQESAIAGPLAPASPLSALRNQSPIGGPWTLRLGNSGSAPATLVNWCLALQLSEPGDTVFPQADLPGSAQLVDFQGGESAVLSGNLTRDNQVDWYLVEQSFPCRLEVSISTNDGSPAPRLFRQPSLSPLGSEPLAFPSACQDDRVSSSTGAVFVPNGREYVRVQRCPDADSTAYELNFQLDTSFCRPPPLDSNGGVISGSIIGANLQPVAAAYVQGGDGTGYFSNLAGDFTGLYTAGTYPLQIFHPEFETLTTAPVTVVPRGSETVGTLTLTPTQYQDSLNDRLFDSGFEFSEGN
ncbi:MAG: carboxypeptidase-like regulatory domain-containing protein, partial [Pseudomonadota bacterium]